MHLIDVLVGRATERVKQFGHDKMTVFGVGRELNDRQWRAALRQLVALGHLQPDSDTFGALKLTDSARGVLKGDTEVLLRDVPAGSRPRVRRTKSPFGEPAATSAGPAKTSDARLQGALRGWRSELARRRGIPAYVVLHDSTIDAITAARPATLTQLRGIAGIGDKKLEHYGADLIALVQANST